MKIVKVEPIPLSIPFKTEYHFAAGARPSVEVLLVRLWTDEGLFGVGETQAWRRQGAAETLPSLTSKISDHYAPLMTGRSPLDLVDILHALEQALDHSPYAIAAVSDALHDLVGKIVGLPVYRLLGGKCRDWIGLCAVLSIESELEATLANAQAWYDRGYRTFTIKIGLDPQADYRNVRAIRERFGEEVCLRVDANAGMDFDSALKLLKQLEPFDLDAAEQPVALWDIDAMVELARRVDIPIMADECLSTTHDLIQIIRRRAASVVQTKQAKNGGLHSVRKLWTIAEAAGLRIYPGNHPSLSLATAAVAHLAAAWPGPLLEGPFAFGVTGALDGDVVENPLEVDGPRVRVPELPGLGLSVDEAALKRFRVDA